MQICLKQHQKVNFSNNCRLVQIRYHQGAGTKMHKCLVEQQIRININLFIMQTFLLNLLIFPIPVTFQPYIYIPVLAQFHAAKPVLISPLLGRIEHGCINTTVTIQTTFYKNMHISIYLKD